MAFITQSFVGDATLELGREEFVRPMVFGAQWSKIRIGVLGVLNAAQGAVPGAILGDKQVNLYMGVCQQTGFSDPSPLDVLTCGALTEGTQLVNNTTYWSAARNAGVLYWKRGSTLTTVTAGSGTAYGTLLPSKTQWFVDYTFNQIAPGATVTVQPWGNNASGPADVSRGAFMSNMQSDTPATVAAFSALTLTNYTGNFNLGSLCIMWSRSVPTMLISEICVTRFF